MSMTGTISKGAVIAAMALLVSGVAMGDAWDPTDDTPSGATTLPAPTLVPQTNGVHFLDYSDLADWFKVTLSAGTTYLFEAIGGTGTDDTEGELYGDLRDPPVASNSDDGEAGIFNFLIVYTPTISGDYYLKVSEYSGSAAEYALQYYIVRDGWDPADDTGAGASLRTMDDREHVEGPHSLSETDTGDWYRFHLLSGNTYRFETVGNWNTYGELFGDAAGASLKASNDDGGGNLNFLIDYRAEATGDYYLKATQISKIAEGIPYARYDLKYRLIEDQWDPGDDSGSGATALSMTPAILSHGPHALGETDTKDWFKFSLVAGTTYRFESSGNSDTEAYLFGDAAGTVTYAYNDDKDGETSNFRIVYTPTNSGTYYLEIRQLYGNAAIYGLNYGIEIDLDGDGLPDAWEMQYFGSTNAMPDAQGDADGFSNLQEYIAGTDPTNSASYFKAGGSASGTGFVVGWTSVASRTYNVFWSTNLASGFQPLASGLVFPQNSYTDTVHAASAKGFYTLGVQLQ